MYYVYPGGVCIVADREERIVEAYIGEYASGKSELAINRALDLKDQGRLVTLVDLDTVEPFYTLRPLKKYLESRGLKIIGFGTEDAFGLGETGAMLNPKAKWALRNEGDIILDIGYGVYGARTLNLVEGVDETPELKVIAVINYSRPMTSSRDRIKMHITELGRVDAVAANTHLGNDTSIDIIIAGNREIMAATEELGLPVEYMAVIEEFKDVFPAEGFDIPVKYIKRYMPGAMW